MRDVFISYAKQDREHAATLAAALESHGWTVWWDRQIPPGRTFDEVIEAALTAARCVLVLWSEASVESRWVRAEASAAAERGILIPVFVESVEPPLEFRNIQAADLTDWSGNADHPELQKLFETVASLLKTTPKGTTRRARRFARRMPPALWATALAMVSLLAGAGLVYVLQNPSAPRGDRSTDTQSTASPPIDRRAPAADTAPVERDATSPAGAARLDLLAAANGGHLVRAPHENWSEPIDGSEDWAYISGEEAVYAFKNDRPATFDTFRMLITETRSWNIKTFELLAATDAPDGPFTSLGTFETQNVRRFPSPWQEFTFPPTRAKYLKVVVRAIHRPTGATQVEQWQLLGSF